MITIIPTSLSSNNIKHFKIIRATLKTYGAYANKIPYQIDHDFRNLTELVWHFYDFSMIYYEFFKFTSALIRKPLNMKRGRRPLLAQQRGSMTTQAGGPAAGPARDRRGPMGGGASGLAERGNSAGGPADAQPAHAREPAQARPAHRPAWQFMRK